MKLTFHKPSLKLAGLYLAVMMSISFFFSASVYQLSLQELARGLRFGPIVNDNSGPMMSANQDTILSQIREQLQTDHDRRYQEARTRVLVRLTITNLVILVGGGALCYYLARRTLEPIEEAHEAQSRFTADASHELRTPLAAMQSETEVALMNPKLTLPQAKERLQSNLEELAKLTALSEGLLRLSRMEKADIHTQPLAVEAIAQEAIARVLTRAEAKHILLVPHIPEGLQIHADELGITEVLVILLDNAIKYSPEKTEVFLSARATQHHVIFTVKDHGCGIKATEMPHIFERFYRADAARSKQHIQGYGLGLAIAKDIITLHGGAITVQSQPSNGSTFTIRLPQ